MKNINTVNYWNNKHRSESNSRYIDSTKRLYHDYILESIDDGKSIIDVGCGRGLFIEDLINKKRNMKIIGTDFSSYAVKANKDYFDIINTNGNSLFFTESDFDKLLLNNPHFKNKFDYVVCMECVEHVDNYENLMKILSEICIGMVFITIPNARAIVSDEHVNYFSSKDMSEIIAKFGVIEKYRVIRKLNNKNARNLVFGYKPFK